MRKKGVVPYVLAGVIVALVFILGGIGFYVAGKEKIENALDYYILPQLMGVKTVEIENVDQFIALLDCLFYLNVDLAEVEENAFDPLEGTSMESCTVIGRVPKVIKIKFKGDFIIPGKLKTNVPLKGMGDWFARVLGFDEEEYLVFNGSDYKGIFEGAHKTIGVYGGEVNEKVDCIGPFELRVHKSGMSLTVPKCSSFRIRNGMSATLELHEMKDWVSIFADTLSTLLKFLNLPASSEWGDSEYFILRFDKK